MPAAVALLAGCGGSGSHSTAASTASAAATASPVTSATHSTSLTAPTAPSPTTTSAATIATHAATGTIPIRAPAMFTLDAAGHLTPPTISIPAFIAVAVSVHSTAAADHVVSVKTPSAVTITVPGHGQVSAMIPGLKAGTYAIDVDGTRRATLSIGGEPGP